MLADDPGGVWSLCCDAAEKCVMLDRDILHPLHIDDVVDVSILVDGGGGDGDGFGVNG